MVSWPVPCSSLGDAACGTLIWRWAGQWQLTVVVKATFALVADGPMQQVEPGAILVEDDHQDGSPAKSLRRAADTAPYKPRADVTLSGHAHAPGGRPLPALASRLAVFRGSRALLDKTVHVYGDRPLGVDGTPGSPEPFSRMPLRWERAVQDDSNPAGVQPTSRAPNLLDHARPNEVAACFAPVSRYAKSRRQLLAGASRKVIEGVVPEIPAELDWHYFQVATADQRCDYLRGDEWLVLDNLVAAHPRLSSQLPTPQAVAYLLAIGEEAARASGCAAPLAWQPIALCADGLHVDTDAEQVAVTWRGRLTLGAEGIVDQLRVVAGVSTGAPALQLPDPRSAAEMAAAAPAEEVAAPVFDSSQTMTARVEGPASAAARSAIPFQQRPAVPVPQIIGAGVVTFVDRSGATVTLSAEDRKRVLDGDGDAPFALARPDPASGEAVEVRVPVRVPSPAVGDPFAGTKQLSDDEQRQASRRVLAPFAVARPGESTPTAPAGAPYAKDAPAPEPGVPAVEEPTVVSLPARSTEAIPVHSSTSLLLTTLPWQHRPPRDSLTVVVKGSFDLVPGGRAVAAEEPDFPCGDLHHDDDPGRSLAYPSDFAHFKPRADVVAMGHAHAPFEGPDRKRRRGEVSQVVFRFGHAGASFERRLAVFGERHWKKALIALAPSDPQPFERMALTYERAFGGPGFDDNPVGVGYGAAAGEDGVARLANLEDPADLVSSPSDTPSPACFGPLATWWPTRASKLGSYGSRWLRERWPYFPDDFDWTHFQCAPRSQQLDYLRGDEPFAFVGMHPQHTRLEGELPGLVPRCFMCVQGRDSGADGVDYAFEEVVLRLDTAVFDLDAMKLQLVWRGVVEVSAEHAPEIQAFYLMSDEMDEETSNEDAHARMLGQLAAAGETDEVDDDRAANDNERAASRQAERAAIDREIDEQQRQLAERLRAAGIEPDDSPPPEPPAPEPEALAATLRSAGTSEEQIAELLRVLAACAQGDEAAPPEPTVRERVVAALAAGASLEAADLSGGDLSGLDLSGRDLAGANLKGANLDDANLKGANLQGALLLRASCMRARFEGARLVEADLGDSELGGAVFDRAEIDQLDASDARGEGVSFREARGHGVILAGGRWDRARFDGAQLAGIDLSEAQFQGAVFDGADLREGVLLGASGKGASLCHATLVDAACDGASLEGARLVRLAANGSVWEGASLEGASFAGARLDGASFVRARLADADLSGCELVGARLKRVDARGARFVLSNLMEAQLERADLRKADFTGANLYGCEVWKAELSGVVLDQAHTAHSKLEGRS